MDAIYLKDSYLKEYDTFVKSVNGKFVVLEETLFYPKSGGQLNDEGKIICEDKKYNVVSVSKFNGEISHEVDIEGLKLGDKVKCVLNWDRRYKLMRMHSAAHVLSAVIFHKTKALITGNKLDVDKSRIDFALEDYNKTEIENYIKESNDLINENKKIKIYFISMADALKDESLARLAKGLPEGLKEIRVVEIDGIDKQADGGTHVKNLKEIGKIELVKVENKGKNNRRLYFKLGQSELNC